MRISFPNHFIYSKLFIPTPLGVFRCTLGYFHPKISIEAELRVRAGMFPVYPKLGHSWEFPHGELQINCFRCLFLTSLLTE